MGGVLKLGHYQRMLSVAHCCALRYADWKFFSSEGVMNVTKSCPICSRREILKAAALALLPLAIPSAMYAFGDEATTTANGGADPYPIPWLDKNGSHNQPAGPNLEPSHIYHCKGQVARCRSEATTTANGGADPYPIPWLDKNGSHNQPAGPNLEPSHIYHCKGQVARC